MSTVRAFIAVEIDRPNKEKLSILISHLKKSDTDIKWVNENQMHLTLKFLGNIEGSRVQKISEVLKDMAKSLDAFSIRFSKIGAFPDMARPRVIWIGLDKGGESLKLLHNKLENQLEKIGFGKENREYKSHLTLGRVKSLKNISKLTRLINEADPDFRDEIKIDRLVLFQSTLTPKGAIYASLGSYDLLTEPCKQAEGSD